MDEQFKEKINAMIDRAAGLALEASTISDHQKKDLMWDEYNRVLRSLKMSVPPKIFNDITTKIDGYVRSRTGRDRDDD